MPSFGFLYRARLPPVNLGHTPALGDVVSVYLKVAFEQFRKTLTSIVKTGH